jgi:hypothetical protein
MFSFEQIEEARSLIAKEYTYIGGLTKNYRIHVDNLIPYTEALMRIRKLNAIIRS